MIRFKTLETVSDGNCFFDALRLILKSVHVNIASSTLREKVVFKLITDTHALEYYKTLYVDALKSNNFELLEETKFFKGNALEDSTQLIRNLLNPELYWGDTYAIQYFEQELQMSFIILFPLAKGIYKIHTLLHKPCYKLFCILSLDRHHYRPMAQGNQFIFTFEQLPLGLQRYLLKHNLR